MLVSDFPHWSVTENNLEKGERNQSPLIYNLEYLTNLQSLKYMI
jgi:hypothetical protein